jgi:putative inorganic carbon (HCO3(-)) transporter
MTVSSISEAQLRSPRGASLRPAHRVSGGVRAYRGLAAESSPGAVGVALFLLVNLILFIRPGELIDSLDDFPIYEIVITFCLLASFPLFVRQLTWRLLKFSPITVFVLALLPAIILSSIGHHLFWIGRELSVNMLKIQAYFLLLVGLVNSVRRLRSFLLFIFVVMTLMSIVVLLGNFGIIDVHNLSSVGQHTADQAGGADVGRVRGLGVFNDPNDLALITVVGVLIGLHFLMGCKGWIGRLLWAAPIAPLLWVFALTDSRGGLLSLCGGLSVLTTARYGWKWAIVIACIVGPVLVSTLGGRQTNLDFSNPGDTAQGRILLWRDAMVLFHHAPILGIGAGELTQTYHQVAHNSFVQTYAEMGLVGGTIFVGVMVMPIFVCRAIAKSLPKSSADELARWNFTILSITVGYIIGMCSLSRSSTVPTFIPPALAGALSAIVTRTYPWFRTPLNFAIVRRICIASAFAVAALEICARYFIS